MAELHQALMRRNVRFRHNGRVVEGRIVAAWLKPTLLTRAPFKREWPYQNRICERPRLWVAASINETGEIVEGRLVQFTLMQ